jgi:transcriptional regulator with XRE-family HTH domain
MEEFKDYLLEKLQDYERVARHRISLNEFADYLGVSRPTVSLWLQGKIKPSYEFASLISEKLGNDVFSILGYSPPDPELQYIERNWSKVSDQVQQSIIKIISDTLQDHYLTTPDRKD